MINGIKQVQSHQHLFICHTTKIALDAAVADKFNAMIHVFRSTNAINVMALATRPVIVVMVQEK